MFISLPQVVHRVPCALVHSEVIMRKPEVFKMACLRDIQRLYGSNATGHFYAGFGNRITDALSYRSVNIPSSRIFTIDSAGEVKMELLELAGYKSSYVAVLPSHGLPWFELRLKLVPYSFPDTFT